MSNFVIGTDNFKKDVRNHDKCEIHAFKAKPFVEAKSKIAGTSEAFFIQGYFVVQSIIWSAGPHVQLVFLLKFVH